MRGLAWMVACTHKHVYFFKKLFGFHRQFQMGADEGEHHCPLSPPKDDDF
jgi:hypothetical protein